MELINKKNSEKIYLIYLIYILSNMQNKKYLNIVSVFIDLFFLKTVKAVN